MRRRRSLRDRRQLEVIDDLVHYGMVGEEGDDLHRSTRFLLCPFCTPFLHQTMQTMQTVGTVHQTLNLSNQLNFQ